VANWSWEDSWVLGSVIIAADSETPDLAGVIGIADYINRLVLSRDEIVSGINRLLSAGLVEPSEPLIPTASARELWARTGTGGAFKRLQRLESLLEGEVAQDRAVPGWELSEADYRSAVHTYQARFAEALSRIRPGRTSGK
jgi:hypothetical protein